MRRFHEHDAWMWRCRLATRIYIPTYNALRGRAKRRGYTMSKSRQTGAYLLLDGDGNAVLGGQFRYDASLAQVLSFLAPRPTHPRIIARQHRPTSPPDPELHHALILRPCRELASV
jgi:hypothetical protein